jgi:hypothetical protein
MGRLVIVPSWRRNESSTQTHGDNPRRIPDAADLVQLVPPHLAVRRPVAIDPSD